MNILDAIKDRRLLGASPALHDLSTWKPWTTFLAATYGLPLDSEGEALFKCCTGRTVYAPPDGGWAETVCIVGRQAGKTRIGALIACYEAAFAQPCRDGELFALLLAQDARAAVRASFSYVSGLLDASPVLSNEVVRSTSDLIELKNGLHIAAYPCRPAAVRGLRARVAILDEIAFFRSSEGYPTDAEALRAVRPCLATTAGRLVVISSPYSQSGALWELHRRHFGRDDSPTLIWQADAPTMNPTLGADYLERMREDDPEAFRSEVLGEFRVGLSTLLDPQQLDACVVSGRRELPPSSRFTYSAFCDPSGGRGDSFTLGIGHSEGHGEDAVAVIDLLRAWAPPFDPAAVIAEAADVMRHYQVSEVVGDRYAAEFAVSAFRQAGISYKTAEKDRSALYLELLSVVNSERIELPEDDDLLRELRGLERRTSAGGRDRVDHQRNQHDDRANAVAGVCSLLVGRRSGRAVRREWIDGEARIVDAVTGQLADYVPGFGRAFETGWNLVDAEEWAGVESPFLSESEWESWRSANLSGQDFRTWAAAQGGRLAALARQPLPLPNHPGKRW